MFIKYFHDVTDIYLIHFVLTGERRTSPFCVFAMLHYVTQWCGTGDLCYKNLSKMFLCSIPCKVAL